MESTEVVEIQKLEQQALTWPEKATALQVVDQASYQTAAEMVLDCNKLIKAIKAEKDPLVRAADKMHEDLVADRRKYVDPPETAKKLLQGKLTAFEREQERIRLEAQRKLDEERRQAEEADRQRRLEEARQLQAADEARLRELRAREEAMRLENATTVEDLDTPVMHVPEVAPVEAYMAPAAPVVRLVAPPTFDRMKGLGIRKSVYKGRVTNMKQLAAAVASGTAPESFLMANQVNINARVKSDGRDFKVPGIELYEE